MKRILMLMSLMTFMLGTVFGSLPTGLTTTTPTYSTALPYAVTTGSATFNNNGETILEKGVVWGTAFNPTTANFKAALCMGAACFTPNDFSSYSVNAAGVSPGIAYHFRTYATNNSGTAYGPDVLYTVPTTATTTPNPAIVTLTCTSLTITSNTWSEVGIFAAVTSRGVCWSTVANPTTSSAKVTGNNPLNVIATPMVAGTLYHFRAYFTATWGNSYYSFSTTVYGNDETYTISKGVATGLTTSNITVPIDGKAWNSIQSGAPAFSIPVCDPVLTSTVSSLRKQKGICYATTQNPTTSNSKIESPNNSETGTAFTASVYDLTPGTTYYVRSYVINSSGTVYGAQKSVTTAYAPPKMTANTLATVTNSTTLASGGTVAVDGTSGPNSAITARGVVWVNATTARNPNIATDSHTHDGTGTGTFTSSMTSLSSSNHYKYSSYATNGYGTSYYNLPPKTATTGATMDIPTSVTTGFVTDIGVDYFPQDRTTADLDYDTETPDDILLPITGAVLYGSIAKFTGLSVLDDVQVGACWSTSSTPTKDLIHSSTQGSWQSNAVRPTYYANPTTHTTAIDGIVFNVNMGGYLVYTHTAVGESFMTDNYIADYTWNLLPNTTYYVRPWVTTMEGTVYGSQITFFTGGCPSFQLDGNGRIKVAAVASDFFHLPLEFPLGSGNIWSLCASPNGTKAIIIDYQGILGAWGPTFKYAISGALSSPTGMLTGDGGSIGIKKTSESIVGLYRYCGSVSPLMWIATGDWELTQGYWVSPFDQGGSVTGQGTIGGPPVQNATGTSYYQEGIQVYKNGCPTISGTVRVLFPSPPVFP